MPLTAAPLTAAPPHLALFDLDHTLLDINSGTRWLLAEWRGGHIGAGTLLMGGWWIGRYALGDNTLDAALDAAAAVYRDLPEQELADRVAAWFHGEIASHARPGGLRALQEHRDRGDLCVLATTSSQYAARCAVERFGLDDAVCTVIEAEQGRLTGRIARSAYGRHKLDRCLDWAEVHGHDLAHATFYTDSYTDLPLLERVGQPRVVHPDRRLRRVAVERGWEIIDWGSASR
jgi:HAD superfamily hydrolase (TIGR01490 family)